MFRVGNGVIHELSREIRQLLMLHDVADFFFLHKSRLYQLTAQNLTKKKTEQKMNENNHVGP